MWAIEPRLDDSSARTRLGPGVARRCAKCRHNVNRCPNDLSDEGESGPIIDQPQGELDGKGDAAKPQAAMAMLSEEAVGWVKRAWWLPSESNATRADPPSSPHDELPLVLSPPPMVGRRYLIVAPIGCHAGRLTHPTIYGRATSNHYGPHVAKRQHLKRQSRSGNEGFRITHRKSAAFRALLSAFPLLPSVGDQHLR